MLSDFKDVVSEFFVTQNLSTDAYLIKTISYYDTNTSENLQNEVQIPIKVIVFDFVNKNEGDTTQQNTLIRTGDKQVFVNSNANFSDIDPSSDWVEFSGKRFKIVSVRSVNPNLSVPLYYELFVRY